MNDFSSDLGGLLTTQEAAKLLGLRPATLDSYRSRGGGPRFLRVGAGQKQGRIRYRRSDLAEFIRDGEIGQATPNARAICAGTGD